MRFTKMHGIGNDYVYVNCFEETVSDPKELAIKVSNRNFGVGSDGLILLMPSEKADCRMRMFNADGSESEMCGNGLRCLSKFAWDNKVITGRESTSEICQQLLNDAVKDLDAIKEIQVETGAGVLTVNLAIKGGQVVLVCVDMGEPILFPQDIPVDVVGQQAVSVPLSVAGANYLMTCVSMGNPHAVIFSGEVDMVDLDNVGPMIETHKLFPNRVNVHFVQVVGPNEVIMRTWERGSGITLACGTGASAVCVAGVLASKTQRSVLAHLPGGDLQLLWSGEDNHVYLAGPAATSFVGELLI